MNERSLETVVECLTEKIRELQAERAADRGLITGLHQQVTAGDEAFRRVDNKGAERLTQAFEQRDAERARNREACQALIEVIGLAGCGPENVEDAAKRVGPFVARLLERIENQRDELRERDLQFNTARQAIRWALGEEGEFEVPKEEQPSRTKRTFWWRTELRERAKDIL